MNSVTLSDTVIVIFTNFLLWLCGDGLSKKNDLAAKSLKTVGHDEEKRCSFLEENTLHEKLKVSAFSKLNSRMVISNERDSQTSVQFWREKQSWNLCKIQIQELTKVFNIVSMKIFKSKSKTEIITSQIRMNEISFRRWEKWGCHPGWGKS